MCIRDRFIANNALLFERISNVELKQLEYQKKTDEKLEQIFEYISDHEESNQKIFFDGQIYDAFSLLIGLIQKAETEIVLVDGYVDVGTLNILSKKKENVAVTVYTLQRTKLSQTDVDNFNAQYPKLDVKYTKVFISYAWASEDYRLKVRSFATDLMGNGIDAVSYTHLDVYKRQLMHSILNWM